MSATTARGKPSHSNKHHCGFLRQRSPHREKLAMRNGSWDRANQIKERVNVQQLRVSGLQELGGQHYPISGDLSAKMSLEGSQLNPSGHGSARIANARAYDEPIQNLVLQFQAA